MAIEFRKLDRTDLEFALSITNSERWYLTEYDLLYYLGPNGTGIIALDDGERIGMATAALYGNVAWIGNVIVEEKKRQAGTGKVLMQELISRLDRAGTETFLLYAYDRSRSLYERLGFTFDCTVWDVTVPRQAWEHAVPVYSGLSEEVLRFDNMFVRQSRAAMLRHILGREGCKAFYSMSPSGSVSGYLLCSPGGIDYGSEVAPFIAEKADISSMLHALRDMQGPLHLYVPEENLAQLDSAGAAYTRTRRVHRGYMGSSSGVPVINGRVLSVGLLESG